MPAPRAGTTGATSPQDAAPGAQPQAQAPAVLLPREQCGQPAPAEPDLPLAATSALSSVRAAAPAACQCARVHAGGKQLDIC